MGEYAKYNGEEIKIGTCESMYYLRYEDRGRVDPLPHSLDPSKATGLRFRLPFPDEDNIGPGGYSEFNRGYRLGHTERVWEGDWRDYWTDWNPDDLVDAMPGNIQLTHPSGLMLNVPCHHGYKLPEVVKPMNAHWNGKSWSLELLHVKSMPDGTLAPIAGCRHCGSMWRFEWDEILPECGLDAEMLRRLEAYSRVGVKDAVCV